ncbi:MAG: hypothetical protein GX446_10955 [Chthonomonadales bacterium]|nr:hypothetical protein [Chthonomonadales bacterium]
MMRNLLSGAVAVVMMGALVGGASAQAQRNTARKAPQSFTADFAAMAQKVGQAMNVRIVVDPTVFVATPPKEPQILDTPEATVAAMVSGLKDVAWRKVYLMQSESTSGLRPERLAAMVRALDMLETGGLVLENPATRRAISVQKNLPVLPGFGDELRQRQFDPNAVYVIYSTVGGGLGGTIEDKFLDLQRQQLELMMQMDPDALAETFAKGMQMWSSLDPQTQSRLFGNMMRAGTQMFMNMDPGVRANLIGGMMRSGMEMWANMPPDQRARITQEMMQMGQQIMGQMGGAGGGRPPR